MYQENITIIDLHVYILKDLKSMCNNLIIWRDFNIHV